MFDTPDINSKVLKIFSPGILILKRQDTAASSLQITYKTVFSLPTFDNVQWDVTLHASTRGARMLFSQGCNPNKWGGFSTLC